MLNEHQKYRKIERLTKRLHQLAPEVGMEAFRKRHELVSSLVQMWARGEEALLVSGTCTQTVNSKEDKNRKENDIDDSDEDEGSADKETATKAHCKVQHMDGFNLLFNYLNHNCFRSSETFGPST